MSGLERNNPDAPPQLRQLMVAFVATAIRPLEPVSFVYLQSGMKCQHDCALPEQLGQVVRKAGVGANVTDSLGRG
jgi:hypothetical protein